MSVKHDKLVEWATVPSNIASDTPVRMGDLRPHLGRLNWVLRRLGLSVCIIADETQGATGNEWPVVQVYLGPAQGWIAVCDSCGLKYDVGREAEVKCPKCGHPESYDK